MTTTLGHAVLGLLALEPGTGYDLARRLRRPVGYFWSAGHSQIYPELARLDAAGLVRHEVIDGAGPRATKRYRVTPAGRRELRRWLLATTPEVDEREILLRVYLLSVLRPAEAISVVASIREHHVRMLAHFRSQRREVTPSPGDWSPLATARATLEWGVTFEEGRIRWCDELLDTLRAAAGSDQTSLLSQPSPQR
jgi:DNA-binding PadR family transcriptional regulator